ncbi:hypothetical protein JCM10213_005948 [Rhodosporidiobolus nylandii]
MPESANWTYKATVKPEHPSAPTLAAVVAGAPIPASKDALLASSSVELRLRVLVDNEELDAEELAGSALAREVGGWLNTNKATLGLDGAAAPVAARSCVTSLTQPFFASSSTFSLNSSSRAVRLNAFSRSARSSAVSLRSASTTASAKQDLERLDLTLTFRSPRSRSPQGAAQSQSASQSLPLLGTSGISLSSQLLHPASLHFTLMPLLVSALDKVAKKLAVAFPLCFNPRWVDRLTNDLPAHRSIAASLSNILCLSGTANAAMNKEVENTAALLNLTLTSHISAHYPPASDASDAPASSNSAKDALATSLLLVTKEASVPDAWAPAKGANNEGSDGAAGATKSGKKRRKRQVEKSAEASQGKGEGKKRRLSREKVDAAETAALADFADGDHAAALEPQRGDEADDAYLTDEEDEGALDMGEDVMMDDAEGEEEGALLWL